MNIRIGTDNVTSSTGGRYGITLPTGSYLLRATSKGVTCSIGTSRGRKQRTVVISADEETTINVFCRRG